MDIHLSGQFWTQFLLVFSLSKVLAKNNGMLKNAENTQAPRTIIWKRKLKERLLNFVKFYAHNDYREFRVLLSSLASDWQLDGPVAKLMDDCALSDKLRILNRTGTEILDIFNSPLDF